MSSQPTLRIRAWSETFLNDKTRGRKGRLKWIEVPVRLDDPDYIDLIGRKGGVAAFGVWIALLELAGTLENRDGVLARTNGRPLTVDEISGITRIDRKSLRESMDLLVDIGWLIPSVSETFRTIPNDSERFGNTPHGGEGRGEEQSGGESEGAIGPPVGADAPPPANGKAKHWEPKHPETDKLCALIDKGRRNWNEECATMACSAASRKAMDRMMRGTDAYPARPPEAIRGLLRWLFGCGAGDYEPKNPARFDWRTAIKTAAALERNWDALNNEMRAATEPIA